MHTGPSSNHPDLPNNTVPTPAADRRALLAGIGGLAAGAMLVASRTAQAGPLNPPAGPVASTGKTLTEVEPRTAVNETNTPGNASGTFVISQPGSYYLTGNLAAVAGKSGIIVTATEVTLDLCGFTITGTPTSSAGVYVDNGGSGRTIVRNGHIRGFQQDGVHLAVSGIAPLCTVEDMVLSGNGTTSGAGVRAVSGAGQGGVVIRRCTATSNYQGINVDKAGTIEDCAVYGSIDSGIVSFERSVIRGCTAMNNGVFGIQATFRCRVSGNTCISNGAAAGGNGGGISAGGSNCVEDNLCDGNPGFGYAIGSTNLMVRNVARSNNTNWSFNANNRGIVIAAPTAAGIFSGNAGGSALAASGYDPNANFTY